MSWRTKFTSIGERFKKKSTQVAPKNQESSKFKAIEELMFEGKYQESLKRLRDIEGTLPQSVDKLIAEFLKGKCLLQIGEFKTSIMITRQIIDDCESIAESDVILMDAYILLSAGLSETGNLQESFNICQQVEKLIANHLQNQPLEAAYRKSLILHNRGYISFLWGQNTEALEYYYQSLALRETVGNEKEIALELASIGIIQARVDPEKAQIVLQRGLEIMEKLKNEENLDLVHFGFSRVYMKLGELQTSLHHLEEGLRIIDRIENKRHLTQLYLGMGAVVHAGGKFAESTEYYEKTLSLSRGRGEKRHIASSLSNLGEIARQRGELRKAQMYYQEALGLFEEIGYRRGASLLMLNIGIITHQRGESTEAIGLLNKSLTIGEELVSTEIIAYSLYYLICVEADIELIEMAHDHILRLKQIAEDGGGKLEYQMYSIGEALLLKKSKRARKRTIAEELLKQVADEEILLDELSTFALLNLCDLLVDELRISGEEEVFIELKDYVERLVSIAKKQKSPLLVAEAYWLQSQLALIDLDSNEALRLLNQAQDIAEKQGLERLAIKISTEYDKLLANLDDWKKLASDNAPIDKRIEAAHFDDLISDIVSKREIEAIELEDEVPIQFLFVAAHAGFNLYTKIFEGEASVNESLVSGFLTALSSFSEEVFAQTLERVKIGEYMMFMKIELPFLFCYIFKGPSYKAMQKMSRFVETLRDEGSVWKQMEKTVKTGKINRPAM
ncbi:MAG: tetratricopeptide repeat protein, partial [Candidatus Thorarchaeota archaeon]